MNTRPISITHVVFGLIFLGITAMWVIGEATDVAAPAIAVWGPVVLIGAGAAGLVVTLANARRKDGPGTGGPTDTTHTTDPIDPIDHTQELS